MTRTPLYINGRFEGWSDEPVPAAILSLNDTITHLRAELYVAMKTIEELRATIARTEPALCPSTYDGRRCDRIDSREAHPDGRHEAFAQPFKWFITERDTDRWG